MWSKWSDWLADFASTAKLTALSIEEPCDNVAKLLVEACAYDEDPRLVRI